MSYSSLLNECKRLSELVEKYSKQYQYFYDTCTRDVVRTEYSIGGSTIHRGYYCPSPVFDIVTGGVDRGKLLNRLTSKNRFTYKYGFDVKDKLLVVQHGNSKEFLITEGDVEQGFTFSKKFGIEVVSECRYIGKQIQSYILGLYYEDRVIEYTQENYQYSEVGLEIVDFIRFNNYLKIPIYEHERYRFKHKNGYLSQYEVIDCEDELIKKSEKSYNRIFDINIKRKI